MTRTLLPYQRRWVQDTTGLKVIEKSRRIGLSWAESYDAVMHAGRGAGDVYYQSYARDMTRGYIDDCAEWAQALQVGAAAVGETLIDLEDGSAVQAFRIAFQSGRQVVAMSSSPRGFRSKGRPGDRGVLDEAAFVDNLGEVLKAVLAFRMWGGRVHVLSTHNGEASEFNALVRDVRDAVVPGSLHTVTLRQALDEGLFQRICQVTGEHWSAETQATWEAGIRAEYGHRAAEELDCIPSAGTGAWLSWALIRGSEHEDAGDPSRYGQGLTYIGIDVARRRDLWVAVVLERVGDVHWVRELRAERDITFRQQTDIVAELAHRYRPVRIAVDQTGMGEVIVEQLQAEHGALRVEGVLMTAPRKLDVASALREAMEDKRLRIPDDQNLRLDLHSVRMEIGPTGGARLVAERSDATGHADRFWALALACGAAADGVPEFGYRPVMQRSGRRRRRGGPALGAAGRRPMEYRLMVQILDHRGDPIQKRELTREISGPTITGTRSIWTSALTRDITPARLASILRESEQPGEGAAERYVELAEWMEERDLHYLGVVSTRKRQVAQIGITIEPVSDAPQDVRDADLVRESLDRDDIEDELIDILDAIAKGYSVGEIIWDTSEREWRPVRIEHRLPQWFDYDRITGSRLQMRTEGGGWMDLPPYKFVTHAPGAKSGLPIRGGLARVAAFGWIAKSYTMRDWIQFAEVYGRPLRLGKYQPGATEAEKSVLYRAVREIGADAAAIIPEGMVIEFVADSAGSAHADMHRELVRYIDSQISIAVLGQTLTTQEGDSGSYALGQVHNLVRQDIERADGRQLAATIRRDLVVPIVTLNHGPRPAYPRVIIERVSDPDLAMLAGSLERLVPLGLRVRAEQIRTMFGLAAPDDDDEVLAAPAPAPMPGSSDPPVTPPARARDAGGNEHRATGAAEDDADPLPALAEQTREVLGPLIDQWADRIRDDLLGAESLSEVRERLAVLLAWTSSPTEATPDVTDATAALGQALLAAHLAGRYDVEVGPVEVALAAVSAQHTRLPFSEQIDFFRSKLNLPTESWTDIWQEQHDRSFVVAGAAHVDLVADLRAAADSAIADGTTLATFRREFDAIVAKHGWSYKGGRDWRTRVIYETNLRSSYAAGRYQQMRDVADRRPFWRYRHSDASEQARAAHVAWDGLVLRHDDPWWDTHYPPNGWGCKCFIEALGESDLERLGKSGPDQAPPIRTRTVTVGTKGPNPRTVEVPEGIDPGWAYAPGQSVVGNRPSAADPWAIGEISRADATARQIGRAQGSNPGGLFEGADGKARYVKFYEDSTQAYGEAVSNRAYRELGIEAPVSAVVRDGDRIVGIANEIIDNAGILGKGRLPKGRAKQVLKGYSADVWLANWDAVGLELDNVIKSRTAWNAVARVDQGGALLMRARAGRKPVARLEKITEWDGFASPSRNPAYAKVLRTAGYESANELGRQAIRQIEAIEALGKRTNGFRDLAPAVKGVAEADVDTIRTLLSQRAALLKREIVPRIRATISANRGPMAHQSRTRAAMGEWYNQALRNGKAKIEHGAPRRGMTDPELVTTYAYTTEHSAWSHYRKLTRELRDAQKPGASKLPRRYEDYALTLNDALEKLPDQAGKFWRGAELTANELAEYIPGNVVSWASFSSSSRSKNRAFRRNTRFSITGRRGKDIRPYSAVQSEQEVLFKAGTRFTVVDRRRESGITKIEIEEVDDA